LDWYGFVF